MLTNEDLDRIERDAAEMEYFPLHDEVADLVKMARRHLVARENAVRGFFCATPEEYDEVMDSAINSQRKEGGEE